MASNPYRTGEQDSFSFLATQRTSISGVQGLGVNVSQESETNLVASFHKPLPGVKDLNLTLDPETQNYRYFLIEDVENSKTDLAYDRLGNLSQASRTESSVLSTRVKTYAKGKLVSDDTLPTVTSQTKSLMSELLAAQSEAQRSQADSSKGTKDAKGAKAAATQGARHRLMFARPGQLAAKPTGRVPIACCMFSVARRRLNSAPASLSDRRATAVWSWPLPSTFAADAHRSRHREAKGVGVPVFAPMSSAMPRSFTIRSRPKPESNLRDSTNCLNFFCVELFMPVDVQDIDDNVGIQAELLADKHGFHADQEAAGRHEIVQGLHGMRAAHVSGGHDGAPIASSAPRTRASVAAGPPNMMASSPLRARGTPPETGHPPFPSRPPRQAPPACGYGRAHRNSCR